ncbi:neprosin family prolyl endopeptidase, partial [Salmonella sp. s57936]|uniref:neprosin family prolyl endopeptidase n=1 Tax=Salmonella sp. s57936 TaxID=3159698 RepID=UPI00397E96F5
ALGGTIFPVSQYSGTQYVITIYVWKDSDHECWWLQVNDIVVGYWPTNLFSHLNTNSNLLEWGGEVVNYKRNKQHTTTETGSGHFPSEGFGKA